MPLGANKAAIMGVAGVSTGDVVLLSSQTISADTTIDFTSGIDSTYGEYIFGFYAIHAATDATIFQFNMSTDGGSNYNVTKTSSAFRTSHSEADATVFTYDATLDLAQGTGFQGLAGDQGNANEEICAGVLHIFNPASTTYVKHFYSRVQQRHPTAYSEEFYVAGYGNTTSAVDAIQFKMASGNMDAGTIKMWGVK